MKISSLKKLKNGKTSVRAVDIQETDMLPTQYGPEDTVPDYVFIHNLINPFFNTVQIKETADNIVDLLKGTRNVVSLQYSGLTVIKIMAINFATTVYVLMMDAFMQSTKLIAHNDTVVMRNFVKAKFGVSDTEIDLMLNNREDYVDAIEHAKDKIFSKLVRVGHFEELIEKYVYDMRTDDQAQYTTKLTYRPSFVFLKGEIDAADKWVSNYIAKLYKSTTPVDALYTSSYNPTCSSVNFASLVTDPASWQKRLDDACDDLFNVTEFRAFKTEYNNLYMYDSLWNIKTYNIKSYFDDSEMAVLMNANAQPLVCAYDQSLNVNSRYQIRQFYSNSVLINNDVNDIATSKSAAVKYTFTFTTDVTIAWIPDQNAGFSGMAISGADSYNNYSLKHINKIVNIHKPACAKDAEFMAIAGSMPQNITVTNVGSTDVVITDLIALEFITSFTYAWSTHIKDGMVNFPTTLAHYDAPLAYRCYDSQNSATEIRNKTAAYTNVFGLPALIRVYSLGSDKYQTDSVQDLYDLYELTPNSLYDARKSLQEAIIETGLRVAEGGTRVQNFAQVLETLRRGATNKSKKTSSDDTSATK